MKLKWTLRLTVVALGVLLTTAVWAQPGNRPGGGMRDNPKRDVERFMMSVGRLEKSGKAKLSSAQAKRVVDMVSPWRGKREMNEAQAKALAGKLQAVLTSTQKKELESLRPARRREGERRGGDDNRRGGGERRGGERRRGDRTPSEGRGNAGSDKEFRQRMAKMQAFYKVYNPFYAPTNYQTIKEMPAQRQQSFKRRYDSNIEVLAQLSRKAGKR